MNTITFDDGVKRQFVLPAAIVLGAHAALLLGFVSNPATPHLKPACPHETERKLIDVSLTEETTVQAAADQTPNSSSQQQQQEIKNPVSTKWHDESEIPIPTTLSNPHPILVGPLSPFGGLDRGIGPEGQPFGREMLDHTPQTLAQSQPVYPRDAKSTDKSGEVVVAFVVDESGRVLNPRVVRSTDPVFEEPTLCAIRQWRFAPGTIHGVPVRFRMSVPVVFHLDR